jgi:glycosyltransferase involved in cell wall biosynthesis
MQHPRHARESVLFLITKSGWGGAQAYVYALARGLQVRGQSAAVACGGSGKPDGLPGLLQTRLERDGIPIFLLPSLVRDVSLRSELVAFRDLLAILRRERPAVLHVNSSKAGGLGALAGRLTGVPRIIFTAHGWAHQEPRTLLPKLLIWLASWATVLLSHEVIAVSKQDFIASPVFFSRRKIQCIRNGIADASLLPSRDARAELVRREPRLEKFPDWALVQAELHRNKGVDLAIRAFTGTPSELALVVLGEGEERPRLEALIREFGLMDRVFLLGFVEGSRKYLSAASFILFPSRKEGLPLALLEAGFAARAVIASRVGGIPEVITDQESGLLVPSGDANAFRDAICRLQKDPGFRHMLGTALRARVEQDFSETRMLEETFRLYAR